MSGQYGRMLLQDSPKICSIDPPLPYCKIININNVAWWGNDTTLYLVKSSLWPVRELISDIARIPIIPFSIRFVWLVLPILSDDDVVLICSMNTQSFKALISLTDPLVTMHYWLDNLPIWTKGHTKRVTLFLRSP